MEENMPPVPENKVPPTTPKQGKSPNKKKNLSSQQKLTIVLVVLVILLPISVFLAMNLQNSKLKERQKIEMDNLKSQTTEIIRANNETNLKTVAKVFSWAARAEMMRDNMEQLNQVMVELVKVQGYRQVVILTNEGSVILSTDKKYEGKDYTEDFYKQLAGSDDVLMSVQKNGDLLVSAPIFGIDSRLGSLVITYTPVTPDFTSAAPQEETKKQE